MESVRTRPVPAFGQDSPILLPIMEIAVSMILSPTARSLPTAPVNILITASLEMLRPLPILLALSTTVPRFETITPLPADPTQKLPFLTPPKAVPLPNTPTVMQLHLCPGKEMMTLYPICPPGMWKASPLLLTITASWVLKVLPVAVLLAPLQTPILVVIETALPL